MPDELRTAAPRDAWQPPPAARPQADPHPPSVTPRPLRHLVELLRRIKERPLASAPAARPARGRRRAHTADGDGG